MTDRKRDVRASTAPSLRAERSRRRAATTERASYGRFAAHMRPSALRGQVSLPAERRAVRAGLDRGLRDAPNRASVDPAGALAKAALVTAVWLTFAHWAGQLFRVMTFAAGAFVVAATASLAGVADDLGAELLGAGAQRRPCDTRRRRRHQLSRARRVGLLRSHAGASAATRPDHRRRPGNGEVPRRPGPRARSRARRDRDRRRPHRREPEPRASCTRPPLKSLSPTIRRLSPDLVVIAVQRGRPEVFGQLLAVANAGFQVVGLPEIYEFAFGRLPVEELTPAWFMSVLHAYNRPSSRLAKRAFDVVVALGGIAVALPLLPPC